MLFPIFSTPQTIRASALSINPGRVATKIGPLFDRFFDPRFRSFLWSPSSKLSDDQKLRLERHLLESLCRRSFVWCVLWLIGSLFVLFFAHSDNPHIPEFSSTLWGFGLLAYSLPFFFLLKSVLDLPVDAPIQAVRRIHNYWCVWLSAFAFWWLYVGQGWINLQPNKRGEFFFGNQVFCWITLLSHVFSLLLLAPSRRALFSVLLVGFVAPLVFLLRDTLSSIAFGWLVSQSAVYCLIGWFISQDHISINARGLLMEAERFKANHFIASISHDLRQPLAALSLKLSSLVNNASEATLKRELLALQAQLLSMEKMVEGSLDLSRLAAGTWEVKIREVALPHLVDRVVKEFLEGIASKKYHIALSSDCPPYVVFTDPTALERILRNMIGNAIRYTPHDSIANPGKVSVKCRVEGSLMRISIEDNGIGIPKDKLNDVFRAYVQVGNVERDSTKGFGLGLSIVRGLASLLKHRLEVDSKEGCGSVFSILIPIASRIPEELIDSQNDESNSPDLLGLVVALVDDDSGPRKALSEWLSDYGCCVIDGDSAGAVLERLREEEIQDGPHFLISDYRLRHGETGIDVIASIRKSLNLEVPAAIWSAETDVDVHSRVLEYGLGEIIPKPPDQEKLLGLLKKHKPVESVVTDNI